jgi:hypothetical protein
VFDQPLSFSHALLFGVFLGLATGAFTGLFASRMLRLPPGFRSILIDALLGAVIFPLSFEIVWRIPWRNTTTARMGDTIVTTISTHYQHPGEIAFGLAVLLPLVHEMIRYRLARKSE